MRRPQTTDIQQREKRHNVFFIPEVKLSVPGSGASRFSHSPTVSTGSRVSVSKHVSMLEASRHRLSIRKSAAFPMQQTAPKPFLSSCADITRHGRDWNAEFQLAWEMDDSTISQAEARMEQLCRVEREFVAEATRTVKQIVMLDDDGPRELPKFLQCYRVDNIFFRVLPDSRSGRNYVASLRGVLQSRTRLLTVPLSCMFFYRGMPVLAQALVPMPREPTRLYGAGSTNNQEVVAEILHMAEALNIPFPDGTLEVYEGLDGRFYLTNSNSTLTPLFVDDTIMKRQEMLRVCECVTDSHEDTVAVLDKGEVLDAIVESCMDSGTSTITDCLKIVCEHLHGFGVNMCLLKQVIQKIAISDGYSAAAVAKVKEILFVEMLARSVKQEFYLEVQGKRIAYDEEVLSATLSKHMAETFTTVDVFQSRFLEVVAKKYGVVDEDNDIIRGLTAVRLSRKAEIVARICALLGVTIEKTGEKKSNMIWHVSVNARVLPQLIDPKKVRILAEKYRTIMTQDSHRHAFCIPIRCKVACWDGNYDEALDLVHATAVAQRNRYGESAIVSIYSRRSVCEVCFATMQKNCIAEGRSLFPGVMRGFEELTCSVTQGRRHIEYGFWILRVALVYQQDDLVTYRSCVEEAVHHFYQAIGKLPAYLTSEHGSWLHLQPYKGLLQCKRLLPSCSVNTKELVERSIELSTIGWASDFFMLYLWDLSLQLEAEGRYEDAIRVLLTAITVSKKKPTVTLDLPSLLMDGAHIYRSWDPEKYSEHCLTLLREAAEKASELFGPHSKQYAVLLNNKGAVEIELNRLIHAGETLEKAGIVFAEAGVPNDDPDYIAYLENLVYLEQRLAARPVVQRGFLRRYPFLATRSEDFPFSDVRPLEDEVFVDLAHKRARMAGGTSDAKNLEKRMKERIWELLRFIQDGDVLKRYPFLPAVINGVHTASLRFDDDVLFEEFARLLHASKDANERRGLESRLREYVVKKAEDTALQRAYMDRMDEEFNEAHEGYVNLMHPIPWLYVLEDERFNALTDQMQKCVNTQGNTARIQAIQEKMAQRVAEMEGEMFLWRGELAEWLSPSKLYSVHTKDLTEDMQLRDLLRVRQFPDSCEGVSVDTINALIRDKLGALWKRATIIRFCLAVDDEELHREFPFLVEMPHHQRLSTLMLYEDPTVANLVMRLRTEGNDSHLQTEMMGAIKAIAARRRDSKELKKWYYDIDSVMSGSLSLENVPKVRDDYYVHLWQQRNIVQAQQGEKSPLMVKLMHQMQQRIVQMNSWMRKVSANGFRRRLRLEAKYPFVDRRHEGYTLEMLDIEEDEEFMSIVEQRRRLLTSPDAPSSELERLGRHANKRVRWIASQRVKLSEELSEKYPFIPNRLEGVETLTICLEENETFAEKAAYYNRLRDAGSNDNEVRCRRLLREMESLALAVAREIGVRNWRESIESEDLHERYPFLPEEPVRGILLGDVRPVQQPAFRELSNKLDEQRRDPTRNAAAIRTTEEQMTALVVRLAEERAEATERAHEQYPFLPRRVLGVRLVDISLQEDELFAAATTERVEDKEPLLKSRAQELVVCQKLNEAQLADNDDAVLSQHPYFVYTSRKCFPLRHLPLGDDVLFAERLREYENLMQEPSVDEDVAAIARLRLVLRADILALHEIEKIERIKQTFVALHPLSLEDLRHLQDHRAFQTYTGDGAQNPSPVLLEDAKRIIMGSRKDRAARVQELDAVRKSYPTFGRCIDPEMLKDPVIAKLVSDLEEQLDNAEGNESSAIELEEEINRQIIRHKGQIKGEIIDLEGRHAPFKEQAVDYYVFDMEDDIVDDKYYQGLMEECSAFENGQLPVDTSLLKRIAKQIEIRKNQIRNDNKKLAKYHKKIEQRSVTRFSFLNSHVHAIPITDLHLEEDTVMLQLEQQKASQRLIDAESPTSIEKKMIARAEAMAKAVLEEEEALAAAFPFLGRSVKGVPLRELALMSDPNFSELATRHAQEATSGDAAGILRLEQELRDQACRIAREVRVARRLDAVRNEDLHERYPFLPEEPVRGILLGDVRPVQQPAFRELSNKLDEQRRDPTRNAAAIRTTEEQMTALVVRLAEERAEATERAHEQYPFLPRRVLGVRLVDISLQEDELLSQLARRRVRQLRSSKTAIDAHATEEEIMRRAEELARNVKLVDAYRGNGNEYVRARNPFLVYEDRKCVPLSELPLAGDGVYQGLFRDYLTALEDAEANAPRIAELENALRSRADELALEVCEREARLSHYTFLSTQDVPGWSEALLHDAEFKQLSERYDELSKDPQGNAEALRELEDAMEARSRAIAEALRTAEATNAAEQARLKTPSRAESSVFAGDGVHGSEHADLAHEEGGTASGTMRRAESVAKSSGKHSQRSVSHASVVDLGDEAHGTRYAFLPDAINGVAQEELYLEDDAYFQELLARYKELVPVGAEPTEPTEPRAKQLREQMRIRAGQLAVDTRKLHATEERAASRMATLYPFVGLAPLGVALWSIPVEADEEFCALLLKREEALAGKSGSVQEVEAALSARAEAMAKAVLEEEEALAAAFPFLGRSVKGVPLRELALMSDPNFSELATRHAQEATSGDAAGILRLEQELRDQACRIAREVRVARRLDAVRNEDLHERYPFLPEEPVRGILLGDVRPVQQPAFRELSNKLDEQRQDPTRNAAAIRTTEEQMTALVVRLAEERAEATERAHEQYPFLPRRVLGVRLGDISLQEDELLSQLARRRVRQLRSSKTAIDAHATEEEIMRRAEELARNVKLVDAYRGNGNEYVRARNPFLVYEDRKCVPLSELPLAGDGVYQGLFRDYLTALEDAEANAPRIAELENALRSRADELALEVCEREARLSHYTFLSTQDVPGWSEALLHDAEFKQLRERYDELSKDPQGNAEALRELEDAMEARSRAIAEALRTAEATNAAEQARLKTPSRAESSVFAGDGVHGSEHADLAHEEGGTASGTMRRAESVAKSSGKHSQRSVSHASVVDLGDEAHGTRYAFLPDAINGVAQEELYLEDDAYFQELLARYKELVPVGAEPTEPTEPRAKQLREQMRIRAGQLAVDTRKLHATEERAASRMATLYPFVGLAPLGVALWSIPVEADEEFCALLLKREEALAGKSGSVQEVEAALSARAEAMAKAVLEEEEALAAAFPFLGRSVKGVPLRELALMSDPNFSELATRHAQESTSGDAAGILRLEQELRDQACRIAREVRVARRLDAVRNEDLHERYPFLPEEPVRGILLGDVRPVQQPAFRELSNKLDEQRRDPTRNAAAIRTTEEQMTALVVRLAEERAEATERAHEQYPFLPRRVLGVRLGDISLQEDELLSQLARRRVRQLRSSKTAIDAHATEEEIMRRAEELARNVKLVDAYRGNGNEYVRARNPFLVYEDRKCVPLSELPLAGDGVYQGLFRDYLTALEDAEANAPRIAELENALRSRADELALEVCEREARLSHYSFLSTQDVPGWSEALLHDAEFKQLRERYDELSKDPQGNAEALRELEDAMEARSRAIAEALRTAEATNAAEQARLKTPSRAESSVFAGDGVHGSEHADLAHEEGGTASGTMRRAESVAKSSGKHSQRSVSHASVVDLGDEAHGTRYAFLPDAINGVAQEELYLEDDAYFQELLARYKELVPVGAEPTEPRAKQLREQMRIRAGQLAVDTRKLHATEERAASRMATLYPFVGLAPLGVALWSIPVEADEEFCALLLKREEALAGKSGSVQEVEAALSARAEAMAKAVLEEEEALAAAFPFLGRSVKGVPLRELALMSDPNFSELATRHAQESTSGDAAGILRLEQELRDQACRIAREVRVARRLDAVRNEDLHERYPFLPEEPVRGILLGDVRPVQQPAFRELSNKLDEQRRDPTRNAAAIRTTEEQMTALVVRLAEERAEATERAHEQYPFLPRRVVGVRLVDISLQEDDVLSQLARRRVRQQRYTSIAKDASYTEKEMMRRAEELARNVKLVDAYRGNGNEYVRARNPFLVYEDRKCVPLSELPLAGDGVYQGLFRDYLTALEDAEANAPRIAELENALRSRADELALEVCEREARLSHYTFLSTQDVPGWSEALLHDAEFKQLSERYDELSKDPQGNAEALRELEDAMEARSRAIAEALRTAEATNAAEQARLKTPSRAESSVFAGDGVHGSEHADLAHEEGGTASGTMRRAESVAKSSGKHSQRSVSHASVVDLGDEAHGTRYAFLPDAINGVAQEELYLEDDAYFQELLARYKELVPVGAEPTEPRAKQLREQMRIRAGQLAVDTRKLHATEERAASRMATLYPFVGLAPLGVALWSIPVEADEEFCALLLKREEALAGKSGSVQEVEAALSARAEAMAKAVLEEEEALAAAFPFLGRSVKGVPLRELALMSDPNFSELATRHAQESTSGDAAGILRLEQELRDQACRIAREVRVARRLDAVRNEDLHERYPFLPEEPVRGILLGDVRPVQQPAFRELSNKLDEQRRDPTRNAAAIRTTEEQMTALVVRLAEERAEATERAHEQYPFLPRRVVGVRLVDISLQEDDVLSQLARRRVRQQRYTSIAKDASYTEKEMMRRAEELARNVKLVDAYRGNGNEYVRARNPFLVYEDRKCVPLSELPLAGDGVYQGLFRDYLTALEDAEANAPRIAELENALRSRADELALEVCEREARLSHYTFLSTQDVPGWSEALLHDAEFKQLSERYDELSKDPQGNAEALRELEDAMEARSRAIAEALRTAEATNAAEQARLRALFPMCADLPVSMEADNESLNLLRRRSSLLSDAFGNSRAIDYIDKSLRRRVSLLALSPEETTIEFCQESEVVAFDVRMNRNVGKHRRLRHTTAANQRDGGDVGGAVDACEAASREGLMMDEKSALYAQFFSSLMEQEELARNVIDNDHNSAMMKLLHEKAAEEASVCRNEELAAALCGMIGGESDDRARLQQSEENKRNALLDEWLQLEESDLRKLVELNEVQLLDELMLEESDSRRKAALGETDRASYRARENLCDEESLDRNRLHDVESGEMDDLHKMALMERHSIISKAKIEELCDAEAQGRIAITANEEEGDVELGIMKLVGDEMLLRQEIEEEDEHLLASTTNAFDELCKLMDTLNEMLLAVGSTEGEERAKLMDEENKAREQITLEVEKGKATARDRTINTLNELLLTVKRAEREERAKLMDEENITRGEALLEAEKEEIELRRRRKMEEELHFAMDEEKKCRDVIFANEQEDINLLRRELEVAIAVEESVAKMIGSEEEARRSIGETEEYEWGQLQEEVGKASLEAIRAQEERETVEKEAQQMKRRQDAQALIKSVVFAYRIRRRLANRFQNRKAQENKNAIAEILRMEFNTRSAICDEERLECQKIDEAKRSLLSLTGTRGARTIAELEKEEDDARHELMDDFAFHLSQLQRASRKALAKRQDLIPSLKQLQEFEENEDRMHATTMFTATGRKLGLPLSDDTGDEGDEEEEFDTPLTTGKYKGYTLDSIGTFLLQYEKDLQRFKASLEKHRVVVAADHEMLKKARDNATQDMVHGGTGALWIPTRPLPLSDLVRGPSAQYRRGRIFDARGQRPVSRTTDAGGRAATPSDVHFFDGLVK